MNGTAHVVFSAIAYGPARDLEGRLSFVSSRDGNTEIFAINADGTGLERLTTNPANDGSPAWSPDGSQIAFVSRRDGVPAIYVMAADGSNVARQTDASLPWAYEPAWSPDGLQLAFVSDRSAYDFVFDIFTMKADATGQRSRTQGFAAWPDLRWYMHPAWSPDGSMIAFLYSHVINVDDIWFQVAVMSADGRFLKDLAWAGDTTWLDNRVPGSLAWSPNGRGIAYTALDCNLLEGSCSNSLSVEYVSLDRSARSTLVSNAGNPSWRR